MMYQRIRKDKLLYIFSKQQISKGNGETTSYREKNHRKKKNEACFSISIMVQGLKGGKETGVDSEFSWKPHEQLFPPSKGTIMSQDKHNRK